MKFILEPFFSRATVERGFCGNPNQMAYMSCLGIVAIFSLIRKPISKSLRTVVVLILVLLTVTVCFTYSRSGFTAILFIIFYMIFHKSQSAATGPRILKSLVIWITITTCIIVAAILWKDWLYETLPITNWVNRIMFSNDAFQARQNIWKIGLEISDQNLIYGYGFGSPEGKVVVDNDFLYVLRNTGIIGLFIYIYTFCILPIKRIILSKSHISDDFSLIMGLVVMIVFQMTSAPLIYVAQTSFVAWLWGGADRVVKK